MNINVISAPRATSDTTDDGKKTVTTLRSKTASEGVVQLAPADLQDGAITCNETKQTIIEIKGTASQFVTGLGAKAGDVFKCWVMNTNTGIIQLDYRNATGMTVFGDLGTAAGGVLELHFIVTGSSSITVTSKAHNPIKSGR